MIKNKIFDEYLEKGYDKNENYNNIYSKIKNDSKKRILNLVATLFTVITIGTSASIIYANRNWNKEYEEYLNRNIETAKASANWDILSGDTENIDMEYVYQDGIGIKINSLLITDYTCQMDIDFRMLNDKKDYKAFKFGFAIYDEENNIYNISERLKLTGSKTLQNYEKKLCKELGIKYNPKEYNMPKQLATGVAQNPISITDDNTIMRLELSAKEQLPQSKKLYIRIFDIGYSLADFSDIDGVEFKIENAEDFPLSNSEWQFEVNIPERFYEKNYTKLKLKENIEDFKVENAILSETNLAIIIDTEYSLQNIISGISISDERGNIYDIYKTVDGEKYKLIFNIDDALDKQLYLNLNISEYNINKKVELIQ